MVYQSKAVFVLMRVPTSRGCANQISHGAKHELFDTIYAHILEETKDFQSILCPGGVYPTLTFEYKQTSLGDGSGVPYV